MKLNSFSSSSSAHNRDLPREELVEGVKIIAESGHAHIHLAQQKLFTLFSLAFQHMLYLSSKNPGLYLIRVEDRNLAEKLISRAKDSSTRRFMERLVMGRKLKFQDSLIYLDYFQVSTWSLINEYPQEKLKEKLRHALIVKDTCERPFETPKAEEEFIPGLGPLFYYESLREFVPSTLVVAYGEEFPRQQTVSFPFIQRENIRPLHGVKLSSSVDLSELEQLE